MWFPSLSSHNLTNTIQDSLVAKAWPWKIIVKGTSLLYLCSLNHSIRHLMEPSSIRNSNTDIQSEYQKCYGDLWIFYPSILLTGGLMDNAWRCIDLTAWNISTLSFQTCVSVGYRALYRLKKHIGNSSKFVSNMSFETKERLLSMLEICFDVAEFSMPALVLRFPLSGVKARHDLQDVFIQIALHFEKVLYFFIATAFIG